jgi:hypothetical protein
MRCVTAEGTTCSLIVDTTDRNQVDTQQYAITDIDIPSVTTSKVTLFYEVISVLEKKVNFIFEMSSYFSFAQP